MADDERIQIGRLGRAHGVRGELRFFANNPQSDLLEDGLRVFVRPAGQETTLTVSRVRPTPKFDIVAFDEIDDRDAAEALTNLEVAVSPEALPELDEGEFFLRDLVGCPVEILVDDAGATRTIGEVGGFFETGANDVMVVHLIDDERLYVPLVDHAVAEVEPDERVVLFPLDQWAPEGTELP